MYGFVFIPEQKREQKETDKSERMKPRKCRRKAETMKKRKNGENERPKTSQMSMYSNNELVK